MSLGTNLFKGIISRITQGRKKHFAGTPISWIQEKWLKHLPVSDQIRKISFGGIVINFKNPLDILHTYPEIFGDEIYRFSVDHDNPLILDCGAHIGMGTLYFKSLYPDAEIHAFEPDAANFELLQINCRANNVSKVHLHNKAVWIAEGEVLFAARASQASTIIENRDDDKTNPAVRVSTVHLKKILQKREVDFLKLDIEGAEYQVIKECGEELKRVKNLFLEYHGKVEEVYKLNELLEIVRVAGFSVYIKNAADELKSPFYNKQIPGYPYEVQLNIFAYRL